MRLITLSAVFAVATALAPPAYAADFTGPRIEVHSGWDRLQTKRTSPTDDRRDGIIYGVGVGYDVALGRTVTIGVDGEFDLSNAIGKVAGTTRVESDAKRDLAVSIRIGARVDSRVLVYARAAYSNARVKEGPIGAGSTGSSNLDGVRLGLGAEFAVSTHVFLKGEYRYSNYEARASRNQLLAGLGVRF